MTAPRSPDTPLLRQGSDRFSLGEHRPIPKSGANDETSGLVLNALSAMTASGADAERRYQRSLSALRRNDVVPAVRAQYRELDEDQYQERWSLVQLLADLRAMDAVDALNDILEQPVPDERGSDPVHGVSTVAEEVVIRTTAIEALSRLAADGSGQAANVLLEQLHSDMRSIRRAAIHAVEDSGDSTLVQRMRDRVRGTEDEWMLELRRPGVGSVPQPGVLRGAGDRTGDDGTVPPPPQVSQ